jgi:hypothetical protein
VLCKYSCLVSCLNRFQLPYLQCLKCLCHLRVTSYMHYFLPRPVLYWFSLPSLGLRWKQRLMSLPDHPMPSPFLNEYVTLTLSCVRGGSGVLVHGSNPPVRGLYPGYYRTSDDLSCKLQCCIWIVQVPLPIPLQPTNPDCYLIFTVLPMSYIYYCTWFINDVQLNCHLHLQWMLNKGATKLHNEEQVLEFKPHVNI